jgi:hypothetical protein
MDDNTKGFWWALGVCFGAFSTLFVVALIFAFQKWAAFFAFLEKWQTLVAGLLSVIAALVAVAWLEKQIRLTKEEEDRRERKQYADRAAMPAALAEFVKYGRSNLSSLVALRVGLQPDGGIRFEQGWNKPDVPLYPSRAADTVRACLETTDKDKREPIAQILRDLQKLNSRLEGIISEASPGSGFSVDMMHLSYYVLGAVDFITRCDTTIPYARGDQPSPPGRPTLGQMHSKAFFANIDESDFPYVYEAMQGRYTDEEMPP